MSSEPAISVNHVSKVYDLGLSGRTSSFATIIGERIRHPIRGSGPTRERLRALDDVTFDVAPGEVVGVIGKNGAGKSTLLKILSRITPPSDGYIEMAGSVGSLLEVGTGFHPELTGIENVYLNGSILGMSKREIDRRLEEILDFAEVDKFLDTPVKRYSSGMRVRLAFAVAAHLDPEILIIDEVLSVGDHSFQVKCLDKMQAIVSEEGRTILYVSHNLVTVEYLCPRALLLVDGQLAFDGDTDETASQYLNRFPHAERGPAAGVFDLAAADRSGEGRDALFTRLELRPGGGVPFETIRMGDRLRIEISVEGLDARPEATVWVTVGSSTTRCIFRMSSRMKPLEAAHRRCNDETIVLDIPSLVLTPGDYHLDVEAYGHENLLIDMVHRAAEFTVIPADMLGTGYHFGPRDGHFVVPFEWELRPSNPGRARSDEARREVG
jgi:lipopolysaccharide transport system ATP-binding protein